MKINPINELRRIGGFKSQEDSECPTPLDVELCHQQLQRPQLNGTLPNFGTKCKIFELDPCQGLGKVCIVYQQTICTTRTETVRENIGNDQPRIWLLDRCFEWHFIAEDFTTYFRMMLVHKGLPQWQFKFTPIGLTPWAEVRALIILYRPNQFINKINYS
jgi:tubulin polyglutamylase complex subunit 2